MKTHPGQRSDVKLAGVFRALVVLFIAAMYAAGCRSDAPQPQPPVDAELEQALTNFEIGAAQRERELQAQRESLE